jgi:hypothetical protein
VLGEPLPFRLQKRSAVGFAAPRLDWWRLGGTAAALEIDIDIGVSTQRASLPLPFAMQHTICTAVPPASREKRRLRVSSIYRRCSVRPEWRATVKRISAVDRGPARHRRAGADATASLDLIGGRLLQRSDGPIARYLHRHA